ncbi:MAG: hypothetical protein FJZ43_01090 [Candidatus Staskawiczbacteria bacterium]|nr:hypothetical protein [Candidatus Staskawiczbacteria bacterium]
MKDIFKNYIYPVVTLSGSIIGVGFLSLPYVALKVGIVPMIFYFILLTAIIVYLHIILGEISLKTPDFKRWPGFVEYYFGKRAKKLILLPIVVGSFGVLLAYLIVGSQFLSAIFSPVVGGNIIAYVVLYFVILSLAVYFGSGVIARLEFWAIVALVISLAVILFKALDQFKISNILASDPGIGLNNFFLPYGAILFSLWGTALIPEVEEMVRGRKKALKVILIIATLLPAVIYLAFIFLVLGISGENTTESALTGLKDVLGNGVSSVALFVGVITTFTAFIALALYLRKMFVYDLKINDKLASTIVCFTPIVLYFIGFNSFISIVSFIGGVMLGIEGILILLIYKKIGGKSIIVYPLIILFLLGIIYSILFIAK